MRNLTRWLATYNDGAGTGDAGNPSPAVVPKTFTQEEVNAFLAKEKKNVQTKLEQTTKQLETLQQNQSLTQTERDEIAANLEALQNQTLTEKELSAKEQKKLRDQLDLTTKSLGEERDLWKNQYSNTLVTNQLLAEAVKAEAVNGEQIHDLLKSRCKVVPVLGGDGKAIPNQFRVVVQWHDTDKSGNPITLELTPGEVLQKMKEDTARFGNLFKGTAVGGTGTVGGSAGRNEKPDISKTRDFKHYQAMRAQLKADGKL